MSIINQYSALWIAAVLIAIVAFLVLRNRPKRQDFLVIGLLVAGLGTAWLLLRPLQTPLMEDAARVQAQIGQGTPVLLEFQSPYWIACTALKPVVDGIEKEFENRLIVIRLNIQEEVGSEIAPRYGFQYTPTFIFFDREGNEVWREIGSLDVNRVRQSIVP